MAGGGGGRGSWGWGSGLIRGVRVLYPGEPCAWGRRGSGTSINIYKKNENPWKSWKIKEIGGNQLRSKKSYGNQLKC